MISEKAEIHSSAEIAENVVIGSWTLIGPNVVIESGAVIGAHVVIGENTHIGRGSKIYSYASVGSDPQHMGYTDEKTSLVIGVKNVIREFTTINRGTPKGRGVTRVGDNNYFMAYTHVAHDCIIGNNVIFANNASVAGHVCIDDYVNLGPFSGVHQFCRIGAYSFLGRATKIYQDILPFMLVTGNPGVLTGLNSVGLRRHGFNGEVFRSLKKAYSLLGARNLKLKEIRLELEKLAQSTPEINLLIDLVDNSTRGIARSGRATPAEIPDFC